MFKVRIERAVEGMHPSEVEVEIATADGGHEYAYVNRLSLEGEAVLVGYPVGERDGALLVELPQETHSGSWRVWVPAASVSPAEAVA